MAYTAVWDETVPLGNAAANTIDDLFRALKRDLREREADYLALPSGSAASYAIDPLRAYGLKFTDAQDAVISLGDNGGTARNLSIKNKTGATTYFTFGQTSLDIIGSLNLTINTNKFTVAGASGNTIIAGTLGVTGLTTMTTGVVSGATFYLASATALLGIRNSSAQAPFHVGNSSTNSSVDCQVLISRLIDNGTAGNAHGFSDSSTVTRTGTVGVNSFDAIPLFNGVTDYDHYAAYQVRPALNFTGTMTNLYGVLSTITITAGTLSTLQHYSVSNPTGAGTLTKQSGLYIALLTKGVTNYGIENYSSSWLDGAVGIGGAPSASNDVWLWIQGIRNVATSQGILVQPVFGSSVVTRGTVVDIFPSTSAAAFTVTTGEGIRIRDWSKGAGSVITTLIALSIDSIAAGGTNYAIKTGTGLIDFGDALKVAGTITSAKSGGGALFTVTGGTTAARWMQVANSGGDHFIYIEASVAGTTITGSTAYAAMSVAGSGVALEFGAGANIWMGIVGTAGTPGNSSVGNIYMLNGAAPTGNPTGRIFKWAEAGAGKARGTGGTVTTWAPV